MDKEKRERYRFLKQQNTIKLKQLYWQHNSLFKECIKSLEVYNIISLEDTEILYTQMGRNFPMTNHGCINWKEVPDAIVIEDVSKIFNLCNGYYEYYILWDQQGLPSISCRLSTIMENISDVLAVSFDTWLISTDKKEVIEFHHEGTIIYGKIK